MSTPSNSPSDNASPALATIAERCDALMREAATFTTAGFHDSALGCYEKIGRLCEDSTLPKLRHVALLAAIENASLNATLNRRPEAIATLERAITLTRDASIPALNTLRASATCQLATLLERNREAATALARLNALVSEFHAHTEPGMRVQVCRARVHVFSITSNTRNAEEARPLGEQIIETYQHDTNAENRERVVNVLVTLTASAPTPERKLIAAHHGLDILESWDTSSTPPSPYDEPIARLLRLKANAQRKTHDQRRALVTLDTLLKRYAGSTLPGIPIIVARAQADKAFCLSDLGRTAEEHALYAEIAAAYDEKNLDPEIRNIGAYIRKLICSEHGGNLPARTQAVEDLLTRFGTDADNATRTHAALALYDLSVTTREADDYATAIAHADRYIRLYGNDPEPDIRATLGSALLNKGTWLLQGLKRPEDALASYNEILSRFPLRLADRDTEIRDVLAKTLGSRLTCLNTLASEGKTADFGPHHKPLAVPDRDAIRALIDDGKKLCESRTEADHARGFANFDHVITQHRAATHPELRRQCARALFNKGFYLNEAKRYTDAIAAFDELHTLYVDDLSMHMQELVALGLSNKTFALDKLKHPDEQLPLYDEIIRRYSYSNTYELRLRTASALFDKAVTLMEQNRTDEALALYEQVLERTDTEPKIQLQVAKAMLNLTAHYRKVRRHADRISLYEQLIRRFGATTDKTLRERVIVAREYLAAAQADLGNTHAATEQTKEVLQKFAADLSPAQRERMQLRLREWNPTFRDRVRDFISGIIPWSKTKK